MKWNLKMSSLKPEDILQKLQNIQDPISLNNIVACGFVSALQLEDGHVRFVLTLPLDRKSYANKLHSTCVEAVRMLKGVRGVSVVVTAHDDAPIPGNPQGMYKAPRDRAVWNLTPLEGVKRIVAVASGKGGVGKSTTAVNLAFALKVQGIRVGLLDADIYGPSLPKMLGLEAAPAPEILEGKMVPPQAHGIPCNSIGFLMKDKAAILRGPMITKALSQLLKSTDWGQLDVLLVDMPPGTGDVLISLAQQAPINGAIIVTTPQEIAVIDASKSAEAFKKLDIPLLGIVENMSWYAAPDGSRQLLFGQGGGAALARDYQAPLLAQIPLHPAIGAAADKGENILSGEDAAVVAYREITQKLVSALDLV